MKYYPLFMDLAGRDCLVVGAGTVAARKARSLLECGARVTVVGERPAAAFRALERRGVVLERRRFRAGDVARQALVIAATDDRAVNAAVAAAARRRGIPVNAVDDPPNCTFIVPAPGIQPGRHDNGPARPTYRAMDEDSHRRSRI